MPTCVCFDLTVDPSDRRWGTVWVRPISSNIGAGIRPRLHAGELGYPPGPAFHQMPLVRSLRFLVGATILMLVYIVDNTVFPS